MRFTPDNFLRLLKDLVPGSNSAVNPVAGGLLPGQSSGLTSSARGFDGGIKVEKSIPLTELTPISGLTVSTGGTASGTLAAITQNAAITDSTGGTGSATFAAIAAGATYAQSDITALKNIASETATSLNAIRTALGVIKNSITSIGTFVSAGGNNLASSSSILRIVVPASTTAIGTFQFIVPRDYDENSDELVVRLLVNQAAAVTDHTTNLTVTATLWPYQDGIITKPAVKGTAPFGTATLLVTTTEQVFEFSLSGYGLKRDEVVELAIATGGQNVTTGDEVQVFGMDLLWDSTIVSFHDTDNTGNATGTLDGFGNALR